jgi:two-component system sensor histidine kinase YesM
MKRPHRKKLFIEIISLLLTVIIVVFIMIFTFTVSKTNEMLESQKIEDSLLLADSVSKNIEKYQDKVITIFINILFTSNNINLTHENLSYFFKNIIGYNIDTIRTIYFLTDRETIISSNPTLDNLSKEPIQWLYDRAYNRYGYTFWSKPYESPIQMTKTIGVVKPVWDNKGNEKGVLIAEVNIAGLKNELTSLINTEYQSVAIFNGNTFLLSDNKGTLFSEHIEAFDKQVAVKLTGLKPGVNEISILGKKVIAVKNNNNTLQWDVVLLTDKNIYYHKIDRLKKSIIIYIVLGLILLSISMLIVSRMFSQPIKQMADHMDNFDDDHILSNKLENLRSDEIGALAESYNNLIIKIDTLMKAQKETELRKKKVEQKMLLSQIKPHFLYNTLVCIISLSQKREHKKIEETIRSLLLLLTFSIDKKEECISLYEELEIMRSYIYIQKIRYGDRFAYTVEFDKSAYNVVIPKLLLQPLVENAIYHGILGREGGRVSVIITISGKTVYIKIKDNGVGMGQEKIREILKARNLENRQSLLKEKHHGVGIINVLERLNLYYNNQFHFHIKSEYNRGTEICLDMPLSFE